jgi:hypothetical protein
MCNSKMVYVPNEIIRIILRKRKIMMWNEKLYFLKLLHPMKLWSGDLCYGCSINKQKWMINEIGYFVYDRLKNKRMFYFRQSIGYSKIKY